MTIASQLIQAAAYSYTERSQVIVRKGGKEHYIACFWNNRQPFFRIEGQKVSRDELNEFLIGARPNNAPASF